MEQRELTDEQFVELEKENNILKAQSEELKKRNEILIKRSKDKITELQEEIVAVKNLLQEAPRGLFSETIGKISEALAKAQKEMSIATKGSSGYNFVYADLTSYVKASRPALTKYGLSVLQLLDIDKATGKKYSTMMLSHAISGEWFRSIAEVTQNSSNNKMSLDQQFGATNTYVKKYQYSGITGVVAEKEFDSDSNK